MEDLERATVEGLRAGGLHAVMSAEDRLSFAERFNGSSPIEWFGIRIDTSDEVLTRVILPETEKHHRGGLGTSAVNGAVIAGMFDCAVGVVGVTQIPGKKKGTVELSIKMMRPTASAPVTIYAVARKKSPGLVFVDCLLFSEGKLCAQCSGLVAVATDG